MHSILVFVMLAQCATLSPIMTPGKDFTREFLITSPRDSTKEVRTGKEDDVGISSRIINRQPSSEARY